MKYLLTILSSILIVSFAIAAPPQSAGNVLRTITPETDSTYNIGQIGLEWLYGFFDNLRIGNSSTTNATTTHLYVSEDLNIGGYASTTGGLFTQGNIHTGGNLTVDANATTTGHLAALGGNSDQWNIAYILASSAVQTEVDPVFTADPIKTDGRFSHLNATTTNSDTLTVYNSISVPTDSFGSDEIEDIYLFNNADDTTAYGLLMAQATTTNYLMIGTGSPNVIDYTGGDLYVTDDVEIDGDLTVAGTTTVVDVTVVNVQNNGNATTTGYMSVGTSNNGNFNYTAGDLNVDNDLLVFGSATTSGHLAALGGNSDQWNEAYSWGDHSIQNYLDKDTDTYVETESDPVWIADPIYTDHRFATLNASSTLMTSATTTDSLSVGGYASSTGGLFTQGNGHFGGNATTTGSFSANELFVGGYTDITATSTNIRGGMIVDSTTLMVNANENRVGIGTVTPHSILEVFGPSNQIEVNTTASDAAIQFSNNSVKQWRLRNDNLDTTGGGGSANSLILTDSANAVVMTWQPTTLNVGIGLTNPADKLDVNGNIRVRATGYPGSAIVSDILVAGSTVSTDQAVYPTITIANRSAATASLAKIKIIAGDGGVAGSLIADKFGSVLPAEGVGIITETADPLFLGTNSTNAITIDTSQRVGILDTSPLYALTVGDGDLFGVDSSGNASTTGFVQVGKNKGTQTLASGDLYVSGNFWTKGDITLGDSMQLDYMDYESQTVIALDTSNACVGDVGASRCAVVEFRTSGDTAATCATLCGYVNNNEKAGGAGYTWTCFEATDIGGQQMASSSMAWSGSSTNGCSDSNTNDKWCTCSGQSN